LRFVQGRAPLDGASALSATAMLAASAAAGFPMRDDIGAAHVVRIAPSSDRSGKR
jgi:hypothetical protein